MTLSTELHDGMKIDSSHCESASSPEDALRSGHNIIDAERDMSVWENARRHWRPMLVGTSSSLKAENNLSLILSRQPPLVSVPPWCLAMIPL